MKHESLRRGLFECWLAVVIAALWCCSAGAQDPPTKGDDAAAAAPPAAAAEAAESAAVKKIVRRLPTYYAKVVTDKQREDIYAIQAKFNEEIAKLEAQLTSLTTKRDAEIEQVLNDEQRAEIARLKSERKTRRTSTPPEDDSANGG